MTITVMFNNERSKLHTYSVGISFTKVFLHQNYFNVITRRNNFLSARGPFMCAYLLCNVYIRSYLELKMGM